MYLKRCIHLEEFTTLTEKFTCCTEHNVIDPECQHCSNWELVQIPKPKENNNHKV